MTNFEGSSGNCTTIAFIFSSFPLILVTTGLLLEMKMEALGVMIMTPLSFLPAANALLTLLVIKNYRQFLVSLACTDKLARVSGWTNSRSNHMQYVQPTAHIGSPGGAAGNMLAVGLQVSGRVIGRTGLKQ